MFKYVQTCSNIFKYVQTCSNMFKHVQICSNMFKYVQTCSNMFKYVDLSKLIKFIIISIFATFKKIEIIVQNLIINTVRTRKLWIRKTILKL